MRTLRICLFLLPLFYLACSNVDSTSENNTSASKSTFQPYIEVYTKQKDEAVYDPYEQGDTIRNTVKWQIDISGNIRKIDYVFSKGSTNVSYYYKEVEPVIFTARAGLLDTLQALLNNIDFYNRPNLGTKVPKGEHVLTGYMVGYILTYNLNATLNSENHKIDFVIGQTNEPYDEKFRRVVYVISELFNKEYHVFKQK